MVANPSAELAASLAAPAPLTDPRTLPVRFSRLKTLGQSAAHYLLAAQEHDLDSVAIRMGAGFHATLFGTAQVVRYDDRRAGKAWDAFRAEHDGDVILNAKEHDTTMAMVDRVRRHPRAMYLLFDDTILEKTIEWTFAGRACRSTPDARRPGAGGWCVDLKSTRCAEPRWFSKEIVNRAYHAQLAFYEDAIATIDERPVESYIVAVENVEPHCVTVVRITEEARQHAQKMNRQWWERLLAAEAANYYGEYVEADIDLELPGYLVESEPDTELPW
jgi:hypothetical protein